MISGGKLRGIEVTATTTGIGCAMGIGMLRTDGAADLVTASGR